VAGLSHICCAASQAERANVAQYAVPTEQRRCVSGECIRAGRRAKSFAEDSIAARERERARSRQERLAGIGARGNSQHRERSRAKACPDTHAGVIASKRKSPGARANGHLRRIAGERERAGRVWQAGAKNSVAAGQSKCASGRGEILRAGPIYCGIAGRHGEQAARHSQRGDLLYDPGIAAGRRISSAANAHASAHDGKAANEIILRASLAPACVELSANCGDHVISPLRTHSFAAS
jgi:hypothetical protein